MTSGRQVRGPPPVSIAPPTANRRATAMIPVSGTLEGGRLGHSVSVSTGLAGVTALPLDGQRFRDPARLFRQRQENGGRTAAFRGPAGDARGGGPPRAGPREQQNR